MTSSSPLSHTKLGATFNIPVSLDLREGNGEIISAHLVQVNTGFFQLSSPVFLQSDTLIDIIFDRQRLELEVVFCKADDRNGYAVGARLVAGRNGEVRREPRIPIEISARLTTSDLLASIPAKVVDISRSGLGLKVPRSIPAGVGIIVELQSGIAFGQVRHCSQRGNHWHIGLSLDEFISHRDRKKNSSTSSEAVKSSTAPFAGLLKRMFGLR